MIRHVWSVLCNRSSIDRETNNISLFEILEQLTIHGWDGQPGVLGGSLELVSLWSRIELDRPGRGEARLLLLTPAGNTPISQSYSIDLREYHRLRNRHRMSGIPIEGPGLYIFVVEFRQQDQEQWIEAARVPLEVRVEMVTPPS